jgi:hypothetical protein
MNKKQLIVAWIVALIFLSGCSSYDDGYEDGYEGITPTIFNNLSTSYQEGYDDGEDDAYYFDLGYDDAQNDEQPRYLGIFEYMEGYKEGQ